MSIDSDDDPLTERSSNTPAVPAKRRRRGCLIIVGFLALLPLVVVLSVAALIWYSAGQTSSENADAAMVLGAAAYHMEPSPVYRERILHGIKLYNDGRVKKLLFAGGFGKGAEYSEGEVGRRFAVNQGVPPSDIIVETSSTSTVENIAFSRPVLEAHAIRSILLVSDPLHMHRALSIARNAGLNVEPSPTPTSRFRSRKARLEFLARETYFYIREMLVRGM